MQDLLKPKGGEAHPDSWHFANCEEAGPLPNPADPVFPIISQDGDGRWELVGTGFYVSSSGLFVTARHVIDHVLEDNQQIRPLAILHLRSETGLFGPQESIIRPIIQAWMGERAGPNPIRLPIFGGAPPLCVDVALGVAMPMTHKETGKPLLSSRMALTWSAQRPGLSAATYAFPNRAICDRGEKQVLSFRPDLYPGKIEEIGEQRDRLIAYPYYRVNFRIHGAASGGPVFGHTGKVIGVNTRGVEGSDYGYVAQIRCLEDAFIENATLAGDAPIRASFRELVGAGEILADAFAGSETSSSLPGRLVHLPMLPVAQPIEVEISLYA